MENYVISLAGNPNSGKTTFFNSLTGSTQHVGNWPGKTVEKKTGRVKINKACIDVVDLPGTYSLTSFSPEESVSRDFIIQNRPDLVVNIVDATNLQRNLYLTIELLELKSNIAIALNMGRQAEKKGIKIDTGKLSELLRAPVYAVDARDKKAVRSFIAEMLSKKAGSSLSLNIDYGVEIEAHISEIQDAVKDRPCCRHNPRWSAIRLIEEDDELTAALGDDAKTVKKLTEVKQHLYSVFKEEPSIVLAEKRHGAAVGVVQKSVIIPTTHKASRSEQADKIILHRAVGMPLFFGIMLLLFYLTFFLAEPLVSLIKKGVAILSMQVSGYLGGAGMPLIIDSLVSDGIINGIGAVLVFLPNIFLLFFLISLLEDSGYFARAAYLMDNAMHKIGLHGKSFIPLMLGFGCNVPAIMSARSLERKKDRIITILINPFMSCSARLPVYVLFVSVFFAKYQGLIIFLIYLLGILLAGLSAFLFNRLFFRYEPADLIMELPPYRMPPVKGALIHTWERGKEFVIRAGTIIFAAVIVIWFLSSFPYGVEYGSEKSLAGYTGMLIKPIFQPLGFGYWQAAVALLFGAVAKEIVISTFATVYSVGAAELGGVLQSIFTPLSAFAFMAMTLIYIPCIATIAVIKKETNSWRWAGFSVLYSLALGWIVAFMIYQGGKLMGFS